MYLSSGVVMDGLAFSPWQVDGKRHSEQQRHRGGLWGGFAKQLWVGGWRGVAAIIQHERGSFQHLLSLSHHALLRQDLLVQ